MSIIFSLGLFQFVFNNSSWISFSLFSTIINLTYKHKNSFKVSMNLIVSLILTFCALLARAFNSTSLEVYNLYHVIIKGYPISLLVPHWDLYHWLSLTKFFLGWLNYFRNSACFYVKNNYSLVLTLQSYFNVWELNDWLYAVLWA